MKDDYKIIFKNSRLLAAARGGDGKIQYLSFVYLDVDDMNIDSQNILLIGDWRVSPAEGVLMKGEETVRLEPKAMEVLVYLTSRPGEVVTRDDLEREAWHGAVVGYDSVTKTIAKLRKALGDNTKEPSYIATIPKRGYRLLAHVGHDVSSQSIRALDKPAIAVLPFDNLSGNPEQEYFADGISEDIITGLSKFHWFFVIARNSSFAYKGTAVDVKQVARELGVQYILEGSVRKAGERVRINAQLIDATNGCHIWAERYDRNIDDIFSAQDEISEAIITTVAPTFISVEAQRAERKTPENFNAWDYTARGNWHLWRRGKNDIAEAIRLFEAALQVDTKNTAALSGLAFAQCWVYIFGWEDDLDAVRNMAHEMARRAIDLDDSDAWAHAILGWVHFSSHELDASVTECERALELNPSLALAESVLSIACSWLGENEKAVQHAKMAQRLSPRDPGQSMWSFALACAEFGARNYTEAEEWAKITTTVMPEFPGAWRYLAASLGQLDKVEEAHMAINHLLQIMPHDSLQMVSTRLPSVSRERMEQFIDGLRRAGLPE